MINPTLNFLIVSDLHAHDGPPDAGNSPSYISTNKLYSAKATNPLAGIAELITARGLEVDWLVTPGDLGDQAKPSCQSFAWDQLENLRKELGAKHLIGTAGNHDIDSRRAFPGFDPKSSLQKLIPEFPISIDCYDKKDGVYGDRYWSRNFVLVPFSEFDCSLLVINSCAFHGFASHVKKPPTEHLNGKISSLTLAAIREAIADLKTRVNIVLVHHHLTRNPFVQDGNSVMVNGDHLIELFKQSERQWLIVHGHQHAPMLNYADASAFTPIILSAGSVAAKTYPVRDGHQARNQIHHVSIPVSKIEASGVRLVGSVTSWSWSFHRGWQPASSDGGIRFQSGFGFRPDFLTLRDTIVASVKGSAAVPAWKEVTPSHDVDYLVPDDIDGLVRLIEREGVVVEPDKFGAPNRLEWRR